ncbi:type II toxin-antitoxin system RelE/ParE family toxin [Patescibacteria group bacterium]
MYIIHIEKRAVRDLDHIEEKDKKHILQQINNILENSPFPKGAGNPKKLKDSTAYRLRIGKYRVLYTIEKNLVLIFGIKHRKDSYK